MGSQGSEQGIAITPTDLRACLNVTDVFTLFRKLRYPVESPVDLPVEAEALPGALRDGVAARYPVATVGGEQRGDDRLDVTLFVLQPTEKAGPMALARGIAQVWPRRFPGHHLLVFAIPDAQGAFQRLIFVNPRRLGEGATVRFKLHRLIVERTHPTRHDADTLNRIALPTPQTDAEALYKLQCEAFDVERLTDEFYKEYARRFREAMARIAEDNKGIREFYDSAKLHTFTQRLFGRMMFLYFLQKKGALNGEQDFVTARYLAAARADENFYRETLEPLFFHTLNRQRNGAASRFGRIPYLNGGLFAADEDDHVGAVYLDNALFDAQSESGLLYFLNRFNFTIEEDTPLETQVALDPEMLGKVFENLLEVEERGKSGTFYTPRAVVAFMCREALSAYLLRTAQGLDAETLRWLLDEAETGEPARDEQGQERLTYHQVSFDLHEDIERALRAVRALDPAVGSGAFPLGMLALLVGVRRALYRIRENTLEPRSHLVEDWKRAFIRDCLYGVDIRREAIEIARLRLWLSLVVDADPFTMEPLPNLDYKLMDGDSLIETLDGVEIYPTRAADALKQSAWGDDGRDTLIKTLGRLQKQYFQPANGVDRGAIKGEIRTAEAALVEATLHARRENERLRLDNLLKQLAILGSRTEPPDMQRERLQLQHAIDVTETALSDLRAGKPLPFFLYRLHFATVFEDHGGFDIVIANPPYVRHEKIAPTTLAALKAAYPGVAHGMADLYVYFYARALQLLRDGGTLCFISSNKFFRAGYGKKLRETLADQTTVRTIIDFGDFPVFDAAAYPCVVITDKGAPATGNTYRGLTASNDIELDKIGLTLEDAGQDCSQSDGVQPPSGSAATSALVKRLMALGTPLRGFHDGKMYYGLKTGLNEAFVVDAHTRDGIIGSDPKSAELIKPYLRGRDVDRYNITDPSLYLLYIGWHCDIRQYPGILRHLEQFREALSQRTETKSGKIPWFALSRYGAEYQDEFAKPKVLTVRFGLRSMFAFDETGFYCNNAMSFFAPSEKWLTALLNSAVCSFCLISICPSVQNGYSQFFLANIEQLPIIEPWEGDKRRLEALVDELQALGGQGARAEALEREVDEIVYRTYGLTPEEIAEIERWHAERRALLGKGKRGDTGEATADNLIDDMGDDADDQEA